MRSIWLSLISFFCFWTLAAQDSNSLRQIKKMPTTSKIQLDSLSIQAYGFKVLDKHKQAIDSSQYHIDFSSAILSLHPKLVQEKDSIEVHYFSYPKFLTKTYTANQKIIPTNNTAMQRLQVLESTNTKSQFTAFEGLETSGSLSRGIRIGNNQNAVLNSELDLQISGRLNDKVSIRASIQDANIPSQQAGYSQTLNEFDQIFIELFSDSWQIRAGDIDLLNKNSYFSSFHKKVQGIQANLRLDHKNESSTKLFGAAALVHGIFHRSEFRGVDGNQGPYKLKGPNGELYILVVSGSERVYVNGILLSRGEDKDYLMDYNAGEIKFNTTYPITSNMRISVEYQYTDRSYTRFIAYAGAEHKTKSLELGLKVYTEKDAKNQPLQQNLSPEQIQILKNAGNDPEAMYAPSAIADTYSENKILYRKEILNDKEVYIFSKDPEEDLYLLKFTYVGAKQGDYILKQENAIARIYEYIAPINGVAQGDYEAKTRLSPPEKLQVLNAYLNYKAKQDTEVYTELAMSNYDRNLYSSIDDENNIGYAGKLGAKHKLFQVKDAYSIVAYADIDYLHKNFQSIENIYNSEFSRDWNLINPTGTQSFLKSGLAYISPKNGRTSYEFQQLGYQGSFHGSRHVLASNLRLSSIDTYTNASYMQSKGDSIESKFARVSNTSTYTYKKAWIGGKFSLEDNKQQHIVSKKLSQSSHRYTSSEVFVGIGDSSSVFAQIGYNLQTNDSVQNNKLERVNNAHTYYLQSKLIQTQKAMLSLYANYRYIKPKDEALEAENTFNSRAEYQQSLFKNVIRSSTSIEFNSGLLAQQEFTYIKVEPGQGIYKWVDYNANNIQELDEFELAEYTDEAEYLRILLPNQHFIQVDESRFSQLLTLQPKQWQERKGLLGIIGKFYNQTSYLIDRKVKKDGKTLNLNPFKDAGEDQIGLNLNFRNSLYFNRGLQRYTSSYTYINTAHENLQAFGLQKNKLQSHQFRFQHKVQNLWVLHSSYITSKNKLASSNFESRNYLLESHEIEPKLAYLPGLNTSIEAYYRFSEKKNQIGDQEQLSQNKLGLIFTHSNLRKHALFAEINYIDNNFKGNPLSPVAYQMLEALKPGSNFTWNLRFQKQITDYLDLNFDYQGKKSQDSKTIHTGSVQLKAYF